MAKSSGVRDQYQRCMPVTTQNIGQDLLKSLGIHYNDKGDREVARRRKQLRNRIAKELARRASPHFDPEAFLEHYVLSGDRPILENVHDDKLPAIAKELML